VAAIGASVMLAARRKAVSPETRLLATGSAAGLAAIDIICVAQGPHLISVFARCCW
jgi:hypothetical protein